jgi:hypothetical protein
MSCLLIRERRRLGPGGLLYGAVSNIDMMGYPLHLAVEPFDPLFYEMNQLTKYISFKAG